jgi:hypothetical protein
VQILEIEQVVRLFHKEEISAVYKNTIRIIQYFDKSVFSIKKFNIKDTIVISGTPRSGTTWLMEIFAKIPGYTYYFEPINPLWFTKIRGRGFKSRTYLPSDKDWLEGKDYLEKAFTGRVFSRFPTIRYELEPLMQRLLAKKLIIKFVRLNRLLPWVAKRFQLRGIFFIIRHPCAVVASQLKTRFYAYFSDSPPYRVIKPTPEDVLNEASKIDVLDKEILEKLKGINTQEEILAAIWCLDNYIPLNSPKPHPWTTVIYEKLMKDEKEIVRLFNEIGERNTLKTAIRDLKEPSILTFGSERKIVSNVDKQLSKWKTALTSKQVERILKVVSDFGLDFYTEDIEPNYEKIGY